MEEKYLGMLGNNATIADKWTDPNARFIQF